jgi:hypothetical protein
MKKKRIVVIDPVESLKTAMKGREVHINGVKVKA